jgi:hypothetical protein
MSRVYDLEPMSAVVHEVVQVPDYPDSAAPR